jgi:hypothetical protein
MAALGKALILLGIVIVAIGLALWGGSSMPVLNRLGKLPGDIYIHRANFSFYFPLTTSIIISIVLSLLFILMRR